MRSWATLDVARTATFEFITNGTLGTSGESVRVALEAAAEGDPAALAKLLNVHTSDDACQVLSRARIRLEKSGAEEVLHDAEREVRSILPGARTETDLKATARHVVDELFRLLMDRAGRQAPTERIVTKAEIAEVLGGLTHVPESDRWPSTLRSEYERSIACESLASVSATLSRVVSSDLFDAPQETIASGLLDVKGPVIIAGGTGSGKSTAMEQLRHEAALSNKTVLIGHAEAYLEGRLDALAADALSAVVGRTLPAATGRQLLNDRSAVFVIDGVSEVPPLVRSALRDEIRVPASTGVGAQFVLVGRDLAALSSVLPTTVEPARYLTVGFDWTARLELVRGMTGADDHVCRRLAVQAEAALGDAAGNPMLLSMGVRLLLDGIEFTDRASIYEATVSRLAERGNADNVHVAVAALGIVFAALLDEGRRYANPVEWNRRLHAAAQRLKDAGVPVDSASLRETLQRTGLVASIGNTQVQAPIHDSYADYLAGAALANGLSSWPGELGQEDEQRVLFAAAIGGVTDDISDKVTRDMPYLAIKLAEYDARPACESFPTEVFSLLRRLAPPGSLCSVAMWRDGDRVVASLCEGSPRWVNPAEGKILARSSMNAVCGSPTSPLSVAVRLWRLALLDALPNSSGTSKSHFESREDACNALALHASQEAQALAELVPTIAPPGKAEILAAAIGPYGLTAALHAHVDFLGITDWHVDYRRTDKVAVHAGVQPETTPLASRTVVSHLVREPARQAAVRRIRAAINDLTERNWL